MVSLKNLIKSSFAWCILFTITTVNPYTYTVKNRTGTYAADVTNRTIGQVTIPVAEETFMAGTKYELTIPTAKQYVEGTGEAITVDLIFVTPPSEDTVTLSIGPVAPNTDKKDGYAFGSRYAGYCLSKVTASTGNEDRFFVSGCGDKTITITGKSPKFNMKID